MPSRNDPCPCGSGLKYKKCCADKDARRDRTLRLIGSSPATSRQPAAETVSGAGGAAAMRTALNAAARSGDWQAEVIPIAVNYDDAPDERAVIVLVVAGDMVLDAEMATMREGEPEDVARMIADRVGTAAWATAHWPSALRVRHAAVAPPLTAALALHGVEVVVAAELPELDTAARALSAHLIGGLRSATGSSNRKPSLAEAARMAERTLTHPDATPRPMMSAPGRWAAWGLPPAVTERIFAAAARFHDAAPWTNLYNTEVLGLTFPDGEYWTACIMGNGGQEFGLSLYSDFSDFAAAIESAAEEVFRPPDLRGALVTLSFEPDAELPRGMRREMRLARWPLPAAEVYPRMWSSNTPGGGISRATASALALALDVVARFTMAHAAILERHPMPDPPLTWTDAETGINVSYIGDVFDDRLELWPPVTTLEPGGPTGSGADPDTIVIGAEVEATLERERTIVADFDQWLQTGGAGRRRLAATTARRHAMIAEAFVDCVVGYQRATLGAVHEYDLRIFLYDWFPRKVAMGRAEAMRAPRSLGRFFAFLADTRGIVCPWAEAILGDREAFAVRWEEFPGGHWWDDTVIDWRAELTSDLDARALIPSLDLAGAGTWGATMGLVEAELRVELGRRWLRWREEIVAEGITDPADARRVLRARQAEWELRGHARHGGRSPSDVVRGERELRSKVESTLAPKPGR